ncbi:MAG: hypothetical protein WC949_01620 [Candidatus Paceibacterota bacterium]|jgi:hypothetical protein
MKEESLKIIYNEVVELHKYQQQALDLMYNKLNWILVSDLVFLAVLYSVHRSNIFIVLLVSLSAVITLAGFSPEKFKFTAKISKQLIKADDDNFLESLIKKKKDAFMRNESRSKSVEKLLKCSQWLLIFAILFQFLTLIFR